MKVVLKKISQISRKPCDHAHDECCNKCKALEDTLNEINDKVAQAAFPSSDDYDETVYLIQTSITAIKKNKESAIY